MSEADHYPDYDLSFLDGATGDDLVAVGRGIDDAAKSLETQTGAIAGEAQGATADRVRGDLVEIKQSLDSAATDALKAASAFRNMKAAWGAWKANAPKHAEIAAAERAVADARETLRSAAGGPAAPNARGLLKQAEANLKDLISRREDADTALAAALERAKETLPKSVVAAPRGGTSNAPAPVAPPAAAPGPAAAAEPSAAAPGAPGPAPALPPAGAPPAPAPGTSLSGAPETAAAAGAGGLDPAKAAAVAGLLSQARQQTQLAAAPQAQPQMAMPAMPQIPQAQQKQPENPFANGSPADLHDLISALGPAAAVAAPLALPPLPHPAPTPISLSTPSGPSGLVPATPGASLSIGPALNAVVTGTSTPGLITDNNVTGRPDGAPPRTATSPAPTSHLATATAAGAADPTGAGARGVAGAPMTPMAPMAPMVPMAGGPGMGGAGGRERDVVKAEQSSDEFLLTGGPAISEAVPGGTIARKKS